MSSQDRAIVMPELYQPFPSGLHPDAQALEEVWMAAVDHYQLALTHAERTRIARTKWGIMSSRMYSTGPVERVQLAVELSACISEADHQAIEYTASRGDLQGVADHLLRWRLAIEDPDTPLDNEADGFDRYFQDLCRRLHRMATPFQLLRMSASLADYALGATADSVYIYARRIPSLVQYREIRKRTAFLHGFYFLLIEIIAGYELPPTTVTDPRFRALDFAAQDIASLANDIRSCLRERQADLGTNLPTALARHHGYSLQEAVNHAAELHRQRTIDFETHAAKLLTNNNQKLHHYTQALRKFVQGLQDWYRETSRYHDLPQQHQAPNRNTPESTSIS